MADKPEIKDNPCTFNDKGIIKTVDFEKLRAQGKSYVFITTKPNEAGWKVSDGDDLHNLLGYLQVLIDFVKLGALQEFNNGILNTKKETPDQKKDNIMPSYVG